MEVRTKGGETSEHFVRRVARGGGGGKTLQDRKYWSFGRDVGEEICERARRVNSKGFYI